MARRKVQPSAQEGRTQGGSRREAAAQRVLRGLEANAGRPALDMDAARAIHAAGARRASHTALRRNPRLRRVLGRSRRKRRC